jgi:hypothetical protein
MPWKCRLIEDPFREGGPGWQAVEIGDMWYSDAKLRDDCPACFPADLSDEFRRDWLGKRSPLIVAVPAFRPHRLKGYRSIPIDEHYTRPGETHGWTVTGAAPNLTCSPSINAIGDWHGWLQNGVLSDDVEGRTYEVPHASLS